MKKVYRLLILFLLCCLSSGCGREEADIYYDIQSESVPFCNVAETGYLLGAQFYQEEPVQLWAIRTASDHQKADIFLYRMDGNRELLLEGLPAESFISAHCYIDRQGNLYHFYNMLLDSTKFLIKTDPSGKEIYKIEEEGTIEIRDICQLENGRIFLNYSDYTGSAYSLGELDPNTGSISNVTSFSYQNTRWLGAGEDNLLLLDCDGIYAINTENGSQNAIWPFTGTTYDKANDIWLRLWDFKITEAGDVLLFWESEHSESYFFLETLHKAEIGEGKIPIVMRGTNCTGTSGTWFKKMIALFNQENKDYFIVLEECGFHADWNDYARQTCIEISAGKGPDIFFYEALGDYAYGIMSKGGFVDLSPYLQKSNINKEDYFPCAFTCWNAEGKIYSVTIQLDFFSTGYGSQYIDTAVLGGTENPDIETLVDALLSWPEKAVYMNFADSQKVLEMFLEGTEDLWGMVDWDAGTCNFGCELFAKILKTAKQYGYDPRNNFPSLTEQDRYELFKFMDSAILKQKGKTITGTLFDDGSHAKISPYHNTLAINSNSAQKDGAWEFLLFLLGEEAQKAITSDLTYSHSYPINKDVFAMQMIQEQTLGPEVKIETATGMRKSIRGPYDLTDRRIDELTEILEEARFLPVRTIPILEIIRDEAQDYFDGIKTIDEVSVLINNRVQLYLDEIR